MFVLVTVIDFFLYSILFQAVCKSIFETTSTVKPLKIQYRGKGECMILRKRETRTEREL